MSEEIKENSTAIEETEESKEASSENILGELALDKEEKYAAKQAKKEAKKAAKQAKKQEKNKKNDNQDEQNQDKSGETEEIKSEDKYVDKSDENPSETDSEEKLSKKKKKKKKTDKKEKNPEDINIVNELLNLIIYIGIVVLICYFVINFVGCRSRVDGDSMNPTLSDADNLWVDKFSYTFGEPERFDVIIFNYNEDTTYVKRIIGLPGETVRIDIDGSIYIDGKLLVESYGNEVITPDNIGRASDDVVLGEDEYFVLGDNRNHSSDSRWPDVGNVHKDDILGKVLLRIYPFTSFGTIK